LGRAYEEAALGNPAPPLGTVRDHEGMNAVGGSVSFKREGVECGVGGIVDRPVGGSVARDVVRCIRGG
jgi:hypothetical protein